MFEPVEVKALPKYRLWVRFADGAAGEADLSHLAGRGVFSLWNEAGVFEKVFIGDGGVVAWDEEVELCPDALYMQVTAKTPEQVFPNLDESEVHAWDQPILWHRHPDVLRRSSPASFSRGVWGGSGGREHSNLAVIAGKLPPRAMGLMMEWASLHQDELMAVWEKAKNLEPLDKIDPLP